MSRVDYKQAYKDCIEAYVNYQSKVINKYTVEKLPPESLGDPVLLLQEIGHVESTVTRLGGMLIDIPNIDLPSIVKDDFVKDIDDYESKLNTYKSPYLKQKERLERDRTARIQQTEDALEQFKINKKLELQESLSNHEKLNARKEELEELMRLYELDSDAYETNLEDMPISEIEKSSAIALEALNRVTRNPNIVHKIVRLAYFPLEVDMGNDNQNKWLRISWAIAFVLLCYFGRPYFLGLLSICYFANTVANLLDTRNKARILQMAYSFIGDINIDEYVEDCSEYYELLADIDEANDIDITQDIEQLDEEMNEKEQSILESDPARDMNALMKDVILFTQTEEYVKGLEEAKDLIIRKRDDLLDEYSVYLNKLKNVRQTYIDSVIPLGTFIPMEEYFTPGLKIGSLVDNNDIVCESSIDVANKNIIFYYDEEYKRQECIDYMKLLLSNYLCNIREKHLNIQIYDSEDLGRDFVEFTSEEEVRDFISVVPKEFGKKIESISTEILKRNKKLRGKTINEYNKEAQEVGKITLDYELLIIMATELDYTKNKIFKQLLKYSYDKGIIIWVLQPGTNLLPKDEKSKATDIQAMLEDVDIVRGYGDYEINGENIAVVPDGFKPYAYTEELGMQVIETIIKNIKNKKRNSTALGYEEKFRTRYIPDNKIWTYSTLKGVDVLFGLQDGDPDKPIPYTLGDGNVHALMGGQTGAGKSACINQFLANMLYMYSPEELELIMIDFKNIEFKMYTGEYAIPHASIIAGTKDGAYAISIFDYAIDVMNKRTKIFGEAGVQKLEDYNKLMIAQGHKEKCMPRIVILIDEFQTMFTEVDDKSLEIIKARIKSITRLARFCGVHLFFTSQSMKDTMSPDILANFSLRAALRCTADVSKDLIGSDASARIKERFGWININDTTGEKPEATKLFRIPFISGDEIHSYIKALREKCEREGHIDRKAKFYDEDRKHYGPELTENLNKFSDLFKTGNRFILGERTTFSTNIVPPNFNLKDGFDENILFSSFEREEQCRFIDTMITQLRYKEVPFIVHCPDLEMIDVLGLKNKVSEKYHAFLSDSIDNTDLLDALEEAIEDRKAHPDDYHEPMFFIAMDWDNVSGIGREENGRITERLKQLIHEGPKVGYHFILTVSSFKLMRMWKSYFKRIVCGYCESNESALLMDNALASKLEDGFAIYSYGKTSIKYKAYRFELAKPFEVQEAVVTNNG